MMTRIGLIIALLLNFMWISGHSLAMDDSKIMGGAVLEKSGPDASKIMGAVVLNRNDLVMSKVMGLVVLEQRAASTGIRRGVIWD